MAARRQVPRTASWALVMVMVAGGCTTDDQLDREALPAEPGTGPTAAVEPAGATAALTWADGTPVVATTLDVGSAREAFDGVDVTVLRSTGTDTTLGALALLPSGDLVVSTAPGYSGDAWLTSPGRAGLFDGTTFRPWADTQDLIADDHPRQAYGASNDGGVVAWAETTSTQAGTPDWRLFSHDQEGEVRLVARSEDLGALAGLEDATPVVAGGRVYWAAQAPTGPGGPDYPVQVYSRSADAGDPIRVEVGGASQPAVGADGLYVVRTSLQDPSLGSGLALVEKADGASGSTPVLQLSGPPDAAIRGLTASEHRIAFVLTDGGGATLYVARPAERQIVAIPVTPLGSSTVSLCGDRLVWTSADQGSAPDEPLYVLDLVTEDLARLDLVGLVGPSLCAGDLIAWRTLAEGQVGGLTTVARWAPTPG